MVAHFWWYVARSGGLVAWALVVAACAWGLLHATRALGRRPTPAWMLSTHRYLSALASVFVAIHVVAIIADSYVHFGLTDVVIPLAASWHPVAVAWGIVGTYLLLAIELTSLARRHLRQSPAPHRRRRAHRHRCGVRCRHASHVADRAPRPQRVDSVVTGHNL